MSHAWSAARAGAAISRDLRICSSQATTTARADAATSPSGPEHLLLEGDARTPDLGDSGSDRHHGRRVPDLPLEVDREVRDHVRPVGERPDGCRQEGVAGLVEQHRVGGMGQVAERVEVGPAGRDPKLLHGLPTLLPGEFPPHFNR